MNAEKIRHYCLQKICVTEGFPFNETALVFKVDNKMFALLDLEDELRISLKCEPEKAIELREQHKTIVPGYHMNKKHWNTIYIDGSINEAIIFDLIDQSYNLVTKKISKKRRKAIGIND